MRKTIIHLASLFVTAALAAVLVVVVGGNTQPADATPNAANFAPINPTRVFDSRSGARPAGGTQMTVETQQAGAVAVAVNITITDTEDWGYLTAWPSGGRPDTSVINASGAGQTIANAVVLPVDGQGRFQIWGSTGMHVLVDLMGAFRPATAGGGPTTPPPTTQPPGTSGVSAEITGYSPGFSITTVSGTIINGGASTVSVRIDVDCPGATTETRSIRNLVPNETRGWTVLCSGVFDSGARIARIVGI